MNSKMINFSLAIYLSLGLSCQHASQKAPQENAQGANPQLELYTLTTPPVWGQTMGHDAIFAGGFSGLMFLGKTTDGEFEFLTHSDRGPNGESIFISGVGRNTRPFLLPEFQPRWVKLRTNRVTHTLEIVQEIRLTDSKGLPLSGLPPSPPPGPDENAADLNGDRLPVNLMGIDPESITKDASGFIWMGEEYRPSLLKFSAEGQLLKRYIPKKSFSAAEMSSLQKKYGPKVVLEKLPEDYQYRKPNRGFESIVFKNGKIYAFLQSALDHPNGIHKKVIRLLEFDIEKEKVTGQFLFPIRQESVDKIGDMATTPEISDFFIVEQNSKTGKDGLHLITRFALSSAFSAKTPEALTLEELRATHQLLEPKPVLSLASIGYDFAEKVEGLALINEYQMAVINDNDFGVEGDLDLIKKRVPLNPNRKTVLGIITLPAQMP